MLLEFLIAATLFGVTTTFLTAVVLGMVVFGEYAVGNVLADGGPGDRPGAGSPLVVRPPYAFMTSDVNIANSNRLKFMTIQLPLFGWSLLCAYSIHPCDSFFIYFVLFMPFLVETAGDSRIGQV